MKNRDQKRGFTLIELMVVLSIIGLLVTVILTNIVTARAKTSDSQVLQNLVQLRNAVEQYYSDNGTYPTVSTSNIDSVSLPNFVPAYISSVPTSPLYRMIIPTYSGYLSFKYSCGSQAVNNSDLAPYIVYALYTPYQLNPANTQYRGASPYSTIVCLSAPK
ncbi:MAG TPA: type II secretion system protein [Candidatus Paceibacterota bacterium]|nr:type II secretion system protein [Candidatus Paceibacterota bacterium]